MFLLNILVIFLIIIIAIVFFQTSILTRRRGPRGDSLRNMQAMGRQTALFHGMSAREAELYEESISIGVCFSRFALRVASANHELTQTKLLSILAFFQGATPGFAQHVQQVLLQDINDPESIDWDYNYAEARRILTKPRWVSFGPILLMGLIKIAQSDGPLGTREADAIVFIMSHLGWSEAQTKQYFGRNQGQGPQQQQSNARPNDYETLGVKPSDSLETIKKRYRELVRQHHPDTFAHLGEQTQKTATERFQAIQAAWDRIQSSHRS